MLNIGVLASHQGTNFQAIVDACATGRISATVTLLICNNANAGAMQRASNLNIPAQHISRQTHPTETDRDLAIRNALRAAAVDLVVLAGYMKKIGPAVLDQFNNRIINVHPALLPKHGGAGYYGERVHQAVLDSGDSISGATVHLVNGEYDAGAILRQQTIPVLEDDTPDSLAARLRPIEHELLIKVIADFASQT